MNQKILAVGTGMMFAASAFAGVGYTNSFPTLPEFSEEVVAARQHNMQRAPLNPNKDKGTQVFGYVSYDYSGEDHVGRIFAQTPMYIEKLTGIAFPNDDFDQEYYRLLSFVAGGWNGEKYYSWRLRNYSAGITKIDDFITIDPETGEMTEITEFSDHNKSLPTFPETIFRNPLESGKTLVLGYSIDGTITSTIWELNTETGEFGRKVKKLDNFYYSVAYDHFGQLYGITWEPGEVDENGEQPIVGTRLHILDPEDNYNVVTDIPLTVNGEPFKIGFSSNNITFDYSTGDLWWSATDQTGAFHMIKIDPLNGTTERMGSIGVFEWFGGMYIPYVTADKRTDPARVENLNFTVDPQGNNKVTLSWTNPTTRWDRRTLNSLSNVKIYRDSYDSAPVATLDASGKLGKEMSWTDENASAGIHKYFVVACVSDNSRGVPASINAFIGKDVPGQVRNLTATTADGKTVKLTWDLPEIGDNEGWYDNSDLSYNITRLPDNKTWTGVKGTSFTDSDIEDIERFTYQVVAINDKGSGSVATSNSVLAGKNVRLPFEADFADQLQAERFTYVDRNGDGKTFQYDFSTTYKYNTMTYILSDLSNDDIIVSPKLSLTKGKTYKFRYVFNLNGFSGNGITMDAREIKFPLRLVGGTAPTGDALTEVLFDDKDFMITGLGNDHVYDAYFVAPVDGEYFVGLNFLCSDEKDLWVSMNRFEATEVGDNDLAAESLDCYLALSSIEDNLFTVKVFNNGNKTQENYKVKIAYLNASKQPVVFAETDDVPAIESRQADYVEVYGRPKVIGDFPIFAMVELQGDENELNDRSADVNVSIDETAPLNTTVNTLSGEGYKTNVPLHHYTANTASQTIYTPAMTGFDRVYKGQKPTIHRIAWEYDSPQAFDGTWVSVYMQQDDQTVYDAENIWVEVTSDPVAEIEHSFVKGHGYLLVDLDEPFEFDPARPIVVTVSKYEAAHNEYLVNFKICEDNWADEVYHSKLFAGAGEIDLKIPTGKSINWPYVPVLHLAIQDENSSVEDVVIGANGSVYFNAATASVESVGMEMESVQVFNMAGAMVANVKAQGNSAAINVAAGLYVIRVITAEGEVVSLKANVK